MTRRQYLWCVLNILCLVGFVIVVGRTTDIRSLLDEGGLGLSALGSVAVFVLWQIMNVHRWKMTLDNVSSNTQHARFAMLARITWFSNLAALALQLPVIAQDAVRLSMWRRISNHFMTVVKSLIVLRISGIFGIILIGLAGLSVIISGSNSFELAFRPQSQIWVWIGVAAVIFALLAGRAFFHRKKDLAALILTCIRSLSLRILMSGMGAQVVFVIAYYLALDSFRPLPFYVGCAVIAVAALGRIIPISLLNVTIGEGLLLFLLSQMGWSIAEVGAAVAVYLVSILLTGAVAVIMEVGQTLKTTKAGHTAVDDA